MIFSAKNQLKSIFFGLTLVFNLFGLQAQNLITVPFINGFVGINSANNSSTTAYYLSGTGGLGWSNVQFAQNSNTNIFVTQGNDIIGMVLITDALGTEHTIDGFIKWRTPSGNSPHTMVFQPATGETATLATNSFNGSASYIINDTKYIGLTFNGSTLAISPVPGTVTGNAATNGLLDALNNYLATFGKLSVADVSVNEGAGPTVTVTVSLSTTSTNTITVAYATSNGTATAGSDYSAASGVLTFTPGQTSRTFTIPITNDVLVESTETINVTLTDPTNASILDGSGLVSIIDDDNNPASANAGPDANICAGNTFTTSGSSSNGTIIWTTSGTGSFANGTTNTAVYTPSASDISAGAVNLTMTVTGATTVSDVMTLTITPQAAAGTLTGTQNICVGSTTTFSSSISGGSWSSSNNLIATISTGGLITGVGAGTAIMTYTVNGQNGCPNATGTKNISVTAVPSTPVASVTVQPTCAVTTGTIVFTSQAGVEYSIDGTTYQASTTFTGVAAGTYTPKVRSTSDNSCTATGTAVTVNAAPGAPSTPAASVTVQPTCAVTTGTIVFTTQAGVEYSIDGTTYQASATFTGVAAGTYTPKVRSTSDNSCTATGTAVTVNAVPSAPSTPAASVTVQPTCAVTTGTIVFTTQAGVEYSIDGTNYQASATFTGIAAGTYTPKVRSTSDNSCTATGTAVTVNAAPGAPSTPSASVTVQPTCAVTTGTIVFTSQAGVEYSIDGTTYQASTTYTGVAAGTYTPKVRSTSDNSCTATGTAVTVNAAPGAPTTPAASVTVQPTCAVTTGTIVFTTQAGVEYSIDGTSYQASATFTGVAAGTYTPKVRSTSDNSCTATGTAVTVNAAPGAPSTPAASVTAQPTCAVTTGTIVFTSQAGVEYSIDGTTYQASATFTGVAAGTYTPKVRSTSDNSCTATGTAVTVNAAPGAPSTPSASVTVQPTCAVTTGTIVFTSQAGVEYSIDGTTYQASTTFTGVAAGTYTPKVRSTSDNSCTATGTAVTVNAAPGAPSTPAASVTVQPTCAVTTGTIVFTSQAGVEYSIDGTTYQASATFTGVAAGTYTPKVRSTSDNSCTATGTAVTVNAAPGAPSTPAASVTVQPTCAVTTGTIVFTSQAGVEYSIDGTTYQASATFTGVAAGTYTPKVRSTSDNSCTATGTAVTVNAAPGAPSTPSASVTVQPTCAVTTGTIVFTTQAGVEYSIDGTTYQASATFTGVAAGTYTPKVRSTSDNSCTATGTSVTVNAAPGAPTTPAASVTVQPTCAVTTGTIVFTTQAGVEYSINGTTYQASATFTGVAAGTYTPKVRSTSDNSCTATGTAVTVNAAPGAPSTPAASVTVQPTCAVSTGTIVFTAQAGVEYSIDGTTYQASATFTGVAAGTYTPKVRSTSDNSCTATGTAVTVNAAPGAPSTPAASVTVQPTCAVSTGTIVFTTQTGVEYSIDGTTYQASATFTGVAAGTYTPKVRSTSDNSCTATGTAVTVNAVPSAPSTPAASVTVQPTCAVTTGTIVFTSQAGVEYSINGTTYQASATFTGVAAGTYTPKVRSTSDNSCTATGTAVTVNAVPGAPSTPAASVTVQPTCAVTTGTIVFTTQAGVEYSIDGTNYQASATFTGVAAGTYTPKVRSTSDNSCTATGTAVTVNAVPSAPSTPAASVTVQPTCAFTTGTIVFTTQAGVEYSIDGTNYQASATFTGVAAGTYTPKVRSTSDNSCTATGTAVTVNAAPGAPSTPSASVTVQPTCAVTTGTIVFTTQAGVEYSIDDTNYQASVTFTGVAAGTYTPKVRSTSDNSCTATGTAVTVNAAPSAPVAGTLSGTQELCAGSTTSFTSSEPGGTWTSNLTNIATVDANGLITGISSGTATITYTVAGSGSCADATATRTITVTAISAGTISGTTAICANGSTTLSSNGDAGGAWSSATPAVATIDASTGAVTGVSAGTSVMTYTVNGTGGCADVSTTATVTVTAVPTAGTISGTTAICANGSSTLTSSVTGGTWSSATTAVATIDASTGAVTGVSAGTSVMTYTVTGTGGCADATATATVTVTAVPTAGTITGTTAICANGSSTLTSSVTGGTWSSATPAVATIDASTGAVTGVSAGTSVMTYTVTGTGGCANATATATVTVTAVPSAGTISGTTAICANGSSTLTSSVTGGTWSSATIAVATIDASTGAVTGVSAGTSVMTYTVNGTGGCANATATATVTVTAVPSAGTISGTTAICANGSSTLTSSVTGGTWSSATIAVATIDASTGAVTGVSAGTSIMTYTVTGTGGCANVTATATVTVTAVPSAGTISGTTAICANGSTTLSSNGDAGGAWSSATPAVATINASTGAVTGVSAGTSVMTYTVTGTGGCADVSTTATVVVTAVPSAGTISGTTAICANGSTALSSNGNVGGAWISSNSAVATINSTTGAVTGVSAGTSVITYLITGIGGCANVSATATVTVTPVPTAGNLTGTQAICENGTSTLSSNIAGGAWSSATPAVASINASTGVVTGVSAGTSLMTYTVTGTGGCANATQTSLVTVTAPPTAGTISGTQAICANGSSTLTSSVAGGSWSSSNPLVAAINISTGAVSGVNAGTAVMTYTVTGTGGCANATASTTITVTPVPSAGTIAGTTAICANGSSTLTSSVTGGSWSSATPAVASINASTGAVAGVNAGTAVMTYTITGTGGCADVSTSTTVTVTAVPTAGTIAGTTAICANGSSTLTSSVTGGSWSSATPAVASINASSGAVTGVSAGTSVMTYTVTGTGGCANVSTTTTVTVTPVPTAGTLTGTTAICANGSSTLTSTVTGGAWSSATPAVATINASTGAVSAVTAGTAVMTYTVTGTGGCADVSTTASVTVTALPTVPTASATQPTCATPTGSISITSIAGVQYAINGSAYQNSNQFLNLQAGSYAISVRSNANNACVATGSTIVINAALGAPTLPVASITVQPTCAVPTGTIVVSAPLGAFDYSINGVTYQSSTTFSGLASGTYNLTARRTADQTCVSTALSLTINPVTALPATPAAIATQPTCAVPTGTINFNTQTGVQYAINGVNYVNGSSFINLAPGNYPISVRAINDATCVTNGATIAIIASAGAPTAPTASATTQPTCATPTGTITVTAPLGAFEYSLDGINYQAGTTFNGLTPGTYNVRARRTTDITCVSNTTTVSINAVPALPSLPSATVTQPTCAVATGSIAFAVQSGVQYALNGGTYQAGATFASLTPGTYFPYVRNSADASCVSVGSPVVVNAVPSVPSAPSVASITQPICGTTTGAFTIGNPIGNFTYSINGTSYQASTSFTSLLPGTYSCTARSTTDLTCISAATSVTIAPVPNCIPVATNDVASTNEDTPVTFNLTNNDTDNDGTIDANTVDLNPSTPGIQTTFTNTQGTWSVTAGVMTFTPAAQFNGAASITYTVNDNIGATSNVANITVNVVPVNDAPIANNDSASTTEDTPVSLNVTNNDSDLDGTIDVNTVDLDPTTAGIQNTFVNAQGTWSVTGGIVTFTPNANFNGSAAIDYTVNDNGGSVSNIATITVNVTAVNDAPIANNDLATTNEDTPVTFNITANDTDVDGTINSNSVDLNPAAAGTQIDVTTAQGTWVVTAGNLTFTPAANFNGSASINYTVKDNSGLISNVALITVDVLTLNDVPVANNDAASTNEDTPVTLDVVNNDNDLDGTIDANTVDLDPTAPGIQTTFTNTQGTWTVTNGNMTFTPAANFNGSASINYSVNDNTGATSNVATITITVVSVNDLPVANDDFATTNEDTPVSFNITNNDTDVDGTININTVDLNTTVAGLQTTFVNAQGTWTVASGLMTFAPNANFNGTASIIYTVKDNSAALSNTATVTVNVVSVNDLPVANNDVATTNEDTPVTLNLTNNDTDSDGTIDVTTVDLDPTTPGIQTTFTNTQGTWAVTNGVLTFTPAANFNGSASINYSVNDNSGATSNLASITINVTAVNDAPIANNDVATTNENTPVNFNITNNDIDIDGSINTSSVDLNPSIAGFQTSFNNAQGSWNVVAGVVTYTPALNFNGTTSITYTVNDNSGTVSNIATITITVLSVNNPPVANNDLTTTIEDTPVSLNITNNDTDIDGTIDVNTVDLDLSIAGIQTTVNTAQGSATVAAGVLTFTPVLNFNGSASIAYRVNDNSGATSNIGMVTIQVSPVNDAPVLDNEVLVVNYNGSQTGDLTDAGDFDPDGTNLVVNTTPLVGPQNGTITIAQDGTFTYQPNANFVGTDLVVVQVCDQGSPLPFLCATDTIFITVNACSLLDANQDCDLDGLTNGQETALGTDPSNPDTDGDGVLDGTEVADGTNPLNPCSLVFANQTVTPSTAWNNLDCDNDGLSNGAEIAAGTDPTNPDTDGDGVLDGTEVADGTNPLNPCSLVFASQTVAPSTAWNNLDCDNDGLSNGGEIAAGTDPTNPDTDGDGVLDGTEVADGTNPTDPCSFVFASQTVTPSSAWNNLDCDNDGLSNGGEIAAGTDPTNPDTDGDGVLDGTEVTDGTNPTDPCSFVFASQTVTPSTAWNNLDCDNDGLTNGQEAGAGTDPNNPDTDGDGVIDGDEFNDATNPIDPCDYILISQTVTPSPEWAAFDCDGDGLANGEESGNGSDPTDPCDPFVAGSDCDVEIIVPEAFSPDGDGANETFIIEGLQYFDENEIIIFNRWGSEVFRMSPYDNTWDGTSQSTLNIGGDALPTGTYFYILDTKTEKYGVIKGYIYLKR